MGIASPCRKTSVPSIVPRIGFAIAIVAALSGAASADALRIGGAGAATGFLPELFAAFERSDATKLMLVPNLGSGGGLRSGAGQAALFATGHLPIVE